MTKDPVCGMQINEKEAAGTSTYKGMTYYFCSLSCKTAFDKNPDQYARKGDDQSQHGPHHEE